MAKKPTPADFGDVLQQVEDAIPGGLAIGLGLIAKALGQKEFGDAMVSAGAAKAAQHFTPKEEEILTNAKEALGVNTPPHVVALDKDGRVIDPTREPKPRRRKPSIIPPSRQLTAKSSAR